LLHCGYTIYFFFYFYNPNVYILQKEEYQQPVNQSQFVLVDQKTSIKKTPPVNSVQCPGMMCLIELLMSFVHSTEIYLISPISQLIVVGRPTVQFLK
jgi:hypothetical protein